MSESIFTEQEDSLLYEGDYKAVSPNLQGAKEFNRHGGDVAPEEPEAEDPDPEIPDPEETP